jgi:hypothetical protein
LSTVHISGIHDNFFSSRSSNPQKDRNLFPGCQKDDVFLIFAKNICQVSIMFYLFGCLFQWEFLPNDANVSSLKISSPSA